MKKLIKVLMKRWWLVLLVWIAIIIQCFLQLQLPDRMNAIQSIITKIPQPDDAINQIWVQGGWMLLLSLGVFILASIQNFFGTYLSAHVAQDLREEMFKKVNSLSLTDYSKFGTASLITRTTNDIEQVKNFLIMAIRTLVMSPTYIVVALVLIFTKDYTNPKLAIVLAIVIPLITICIVILLILALPLFKQLQINIDNITITLRENLTGIRVIRAYNQQKTENKKFDEVNFIGSKTILKANRIMAATDPIISIFFNLAYVGIFALGYFLMEGITISDTSALANEISGIVVVSQYSMQIMQSFIMLAFVLVLLPQTMASMSRINEVLKCEDTVKECDHNKFNEELFQKREKGSIEFKDVSFCYPDSNTPVIEHISFKTKPGTTTAIIGSTGSGKSTIINLIPRFYDTTSGEIILDNYNIKDIPQKTLRDCIGFVPQQALLFSGTIEENIRFGNKNASDEEILEALSVAQTEHFISKLPNGTKTFVSQGGKNFSGGQKQRLCIARALVKKPEIYVFDDSFSALDFKTDAKLRQALKKYIVNSSIIIVAQRVSSILDADNIIVLNEGKCVGQGTHAELLKSCPIYQDIVKSQLDPDEVEKTINILNSIKSEGGN